MKKHAFLWLLLFLVPSGARAAVRVGLDVLDAEGCGPLRNRRVGLVVHAASVTTDGRHAVDVLRARGVPLVRLFAPEHGLASRIEAGAGLDDDRDPASGLPIVSLYGAKQQPSPEDLKDVDVLVFDLQDAGVRFYTYLGTMLLCLEAAADAGIEMVVLDRPNPLGGDLVEGPELDPRQELRSFPRLTPGPLVHGLTAAEVARLAASRLSKRPRLTVIPMEGWKRTMRWADTGRPWVAPSPNLRSPEAALAYAGTALLEATNVSEGRGTDDPFLLVGAPWLSPEGAIAAVHAPGFALTRARFTPRASEAALEPKYTDEECRGLRVSVTSPGKARPYAFGIALLSRLRRQPGFRWLRDGEILDVLLGTRRPRQALDAGASADAILRADAPRVEAFRRFRRPWLLY
jgi:uncharacterized protein YbbC (DUF1343 family)